MNRRTQTWLAVIIVGIGLIPVAVAGLFVYKSFMRVSLHPDAKEVPSVPSASKSERWAKAVADGQQAVRTELAEHNLPGLSVAVGIDGEIVWAEGFGWADIDNKSRVGPDTRFRTGGVSTALTSAAIGRLLETGRLKLDDEIQAYVPAFPKQQWPITVRGLMGHTAGIRGDNGDEESLASCERTGDGLQRFAEQPLLAEPGTRFRYTPYGWILLSAAIEEIVDEPFFAFMRREIFDPLGMTNTRPDAPTEPNPNRASFYYPTFAADPRYGPDPAREGDYSCMSGGGAFLSTPGDLVRFGMAANGGSLLRPETLATLQTVQRLTSGEETGYGLGWDLESVQLAGVNERSVGHDGEYMLGGSSSLLILPSRGIVVAVMTNISFADTAAMAVKIAEPFAAARQTPAGR